MKKMRSSEKIEDVSYNLNLLASAADELKNVSLAWKYERHLAANVQAEKQNARRIRNKLNRRIKKTKEKEEQMRLGTQNQEKI